MDAYLVIGNPNTRRASVIRCLSGCFNRSVRDILTEDASRPLKLYARVGALQETRTSAEDFIAEAGRTRCDAVLACLSASALRGGGGDFPDAQAYLQAFRDAGWRIRAIAVLGQNTGGLRGPHVRQFASAGTQPLNLTAAEVRSLFRWR